MHETFDAANLYSHHYLFSNLRFSSGRQKASASPAPVEKTPPPSAESERTPAAKGEPAPILETMPPPPGERELVVAIKIAPPFVMKHNDGSFYGIGVDLWRRVANRLQLRYGFLEQPDAAALIKGIEEGSLRRLLRSAVRYG